jgi:hypothetical protein
MIAWSGDRYSVVGKRIVRVPTGPIPGNTPMSVPSNAPMKQKKIFTGCRIT